MRVVASRVSSGERPRPHRYLHLTDDAGHRAIGRGVAAPSLLARRRRLPAIGSARRRRRAPRRGRRRPRSRRRAGGGAPALRPIPRCRPLRPLRAGDRSPRPHRAAPRPLARGVPRPRCLRDRARERAAAPGARCDTLAERAAALAASGFTALKIKLRAQDDAGFARELAALSAPCARCLPLPFELRLDANGAWPTRRRAPPPRRARSPSRPATSSSRSPPGSLHRLGALRRALGRRRVARAVRSSRRALLSSRGCAAFVLKPAILGGLLRARELALARAGARHRRRRHPPLRRPVRDGRRLRAGPLAAGPAARLWPRAARRVRCVRALRRRARPSPSSRAPAVPAIERRSPASASRSTWVCAGHD